MSKRFPTLKPVDILNALKRAGFFVHHIKGSHHYLGHPTRKMPRQYVCVALHRVDLKRGMVMEIVKQAGMSINEFLEFL